MNMLKRLMLWQKFAGLGVIGLLLTAVPLTLYINESGKQIAAAAHEARGLAPARAVLAVITLLQQHRGMSAVYLNGNETMAAARAEKEKEVVAALGAADAAIAAIDDEQMSRLWANAHKNWASLPQKVASRTISAPQSFADHTAVITTLFAINDRIVTSFGLALDPNPATHYLVEAALIHSPQLNETLGRMRGRGAGALTAQTVALQERAAIIGMHARATELYAEVESALGKATAAAPALQAQLQAPLAQSLQIGREIMQLTEDRILLPEVLDYPAADYFAKTTAAITAQLKLYDATTAQLERLLGERQVQLRNMQFAAVASVLLLGLLAAMLGWLITRSISLPLRDAVGIARRIAEGDLSQRIAVDSNNETGQLLHALSDMNASLARIVSEVRSGTVAIAGGSAEIASANMDLSARTENQASALEETASSMEEITGTVQQNTASARQANELARSASDVAERGGTMVAQVVDTMGAINDASRKVADIINVINSISFQTNILALNAAVEAARAGEQGKGFAVVATEVRSLAQRSAAAAKEIEVLIKDSVGRAAAGAELAGKTGRTMNEIVESIRSVTTLVSEIASASEQQSAGIGQINQAVTEMDSTTQQNAALVEQAAAAAEGLREQADSLADLVSVFKLNAEHGAAPASAAQPRLVPNSTLRLAVSAGALRANPARHAA